MKAIAANAFVPKCTRQGKALRYFRHRAVKSGVEASDLRQTGEVGTHRFNAGDLVRQMQRRERESNFAVR